MRLLCLFMMVASLCAVPSLSNAAVIPVSNPSFETLPPGGLPLGSCGTGCAYSATSIPGWTNGGSSGQFQPGTQDGNTSHFTTLSDGITSAYSNDGTISQTVGATVQTGVVYTLMVDLGWRNDTAFGASADLLINGITYAATGLTPVQGNWSTYTATYTGLSADNGKSITIELRTSGAQGNFDNVSLSDNVPEPAFTWILGLCLTGLGALRRRRR